jgi:hypothetical protein
LRYKNSGGGGGGGALIMINLRKVISVAIVFSLALCSCNGNAKKVARLEEDNEGLNKRLSVLKKMEAASKLVVNEITKCGEQYDVCMKNHTDLNSSDVKEICSNDSDVLMKCNKYHSGLNEQKKLRNELRVLEGENPSADNGKKSTDDKKTSS